MGIEVRQSEWLSPVAFVEVHEHRLLEFGHAVVDGNGVVSTVEAMKECLDIRFLDMSNVGGGLAGFLPSDDCVVRDEAECVNDDLSLDTLNWINDIGDSFWVELLKCLSDYILAILSCI